MKYLRIVADIRQDLRTVLIQPKPTLRYSNMSTETLMINDGQDTIMSGHKQHRREPCSQKRLVGLVLLAAALLCACVSQPERTLPSEATRDKPWGALTVDEGLEFEAATPNYDSILTERVKRQQQRSQGRIPLRILAISGGGIKGNYGAGVLVGWSESGRRPEFDVVTGVSVGSLMAPFVYLGSAYDRELGASAAEAVGILSSSKSRPKLFKTGSPYVGESFRALAQRWYTDELIEAVAVEHLRGRRLFVGTTNLDGRDFTVWDLGMIAASQHPDKGEVFRKALVASASVPMLFPPVMFNVDTVDGQAEQMHVDGGFHDNVFIADYDSNWARIRELLALDEQDFCVDTFVLHNGYLNERPLQAPVKNKMIPFISASLDSIMSKNARGGVYELWLSSMIFGARFNLVAIPADIQYATSLSDVNPEETSRMFEVGRTRGKTGQPWQVIPPPDSLYELRRALGGEPLDQAFDRSYYRHVVSQVEQDDPSGGASQHAYDSFCDK